MFKYFLIIFLSTLFSNLSLAKDINIQEDINLKLVCDFEKKIIKNSKYNYETFLAKDLNEKGLDKFEIQSKQPETLLIKGLTLFLSESARLNVKIVSNDIVLFKSIDETGNYSESAIIDRKSGELMHEITRNIKSENSEKDIYFYRTYSNGQEDIMQSWFRWKLPGKVQFLAVDSDILYAVTEQQHEYTLVSASLNQTPEEMILVNSDGEKMNPCMDLYAAADSIRFKGVDSFIITNAGTGYTSAPTVTITPKQADIGSGAEATATVSGGAVTAITLTDAGSGYEEGALVTFSGGGGSNAAATCKIYDGSKVYLPWQEDDTLDSILVVASDASDLTNPTFVESGFTLTPDVDLDGVGEYFAVPQKDLTAVAAKTIVGYKYLFDVHIPKTYFRLDPQGTMSDFTATLTIARMKFFTGLSGVVGFRLNRLGTDDYDDVNPVFLADLNKANDVPLDNQMIVTVPIHQRNSNFNLRLYSDSPFPVSLSSMMWEGYYSPRFYRRA